MGQLPPLGACRCACLRPLSREGAPVVAASLPQLSPKQSPCLVLPSRVAIQCPHLRTGAPSSTSPLPSDTRDKFTRHRLLNTTTITVYTMFVYDKQPSLTANYREEISTRAYRLYPQTSIIALSWPLRTTPTASCQSHFSRRTPRPSRPVDPKQPSLA